jgi:hypothetical protein
MHVAIISIEVVLNSFIRKRVIAKSSDLMSVLLKKPVSLLYNKIGKHYTIIRLYYETVIN